MLAWEEGERSSFEDSDRFEDESICSWLSDPDSLSNNWRGWKKTNNGSTTSAPTVSTPKLRDPDVGIKNLAELCAKTVAAHIPFELVEQMMPVVPDQIQLWIAYWSFPENEEDIRLYSCLANGNADEFTRGENLYKHNNIEDLLQIGFHLSAIVQVVNSKDKLQVAVTFDRGRITTCNCTCSSNASWCSHVVAVCLHRIHQPKKVKLRAPVSESLSRLHRDQLQKFAQYLISELPQQILPTAQRLIDEILSSQNSAINTFSGAPDPTAGASANEMTAWLLDESNLHGNINKILVKFCVPSMVYSDVNFLVSSAPPVSTEWQSLLRPLRGREPEGMWNLLSIVREMFKRHDHNAIPLLQIITDECLITEKILVWWVHTRVALHSGCGGKNGVNGNSHGSQYACASLCDEIVALWRLVALNPALSPSEREMITQQFKDWHLKVIEKVSKSKDVSTNNTNNANNKRTTEHFIFPGFKSAIEACQLSWDDYHLPGITYAPGSSGYYCPVLCCKPDLPHEHSAPISNPIARLPAQYGGLKRHPNPAKSSLVWAAVKEAQQAAAIPTRSSSVSSEGFCDNDVGRDSDSSNDHTPPVRSRGNSIYAPPSPAVEAPAAALLGAAALEPPVVDKPDEVEPAVPAQPSNKLENANGGKKKTDYFSSLRKLEDPTEILLARAEGLYAHGHIQDSIRLAFHLAEDILINPPNMMHDLVIPTTRSRKRRVFHANQQITNLPSTTLAKCAFLCTVLAEDPHRTHLSFQVALFGLEIPRPPALTKPLEVKLANQESDLVSLLKRLPLGPEELFVIRQRAELLRSGTYNSRGESLLPFMLAAFVFDALVISTPARITLGRQNYQNPNDEKLGFEAAVAVLGMKANISEAEHPLLCEGTRRQRGDLALSLLTHYKDDKQRLSIIMDKFLDKGIHQMYKAPALPTYYVNNPNGAQVVDTNDQSRTRLTSPPVARPTANTSYMTPMQHPPAPHTWNRVSNNLYPSQYANEFPAAANTDTTNESMDYAMANMNLNARPAAWMGGGARPKTSNPMSPAYQQPEPEHREHFTEFHSKPQVNISMESWQQEFKLWEANKQKKRSAINNQIRTGNTWKSGGPGSDSGSSGHSSDSAGSLSGSDKGIVEAPKTVESPPLPPQAQKPTVPTVNEAPSNRTQPIFTKNANKYKGKRAYPTVPNQPSEAGAYFMFELAKNIVSKAGGTSSTSLFKQPPTNTQNHRGPHRALQMCAFQVGLYALGLSNTVSPNWLSRTYSSHVSWISNQALDIGSSALAFLINTWEFHLTPCEVASIADKASRGRDLNTVKEAANLALSCLPHAHALNPNEIQRAMIQCKEQSSQMLEDACLAVESDAKNGGVYPEVLFSVARNWFDLYETRNTRQNSRRGRPADELERSLSPLSPPIPSTGVNNQGHSQPPPGNVNMGNLHQQPVPVSVPGNVHNIPTYPPNNQTPVNYGIPGVSYPMSYNYFPNMPTNVPCLNGQVPVQMYIQPTGVPFHGNQGAVAQPVLPPAHLQSLQYFPSASIPSPMAQATRNSIVNAPMGNMVPPHCQAGPPPNCNNMPVNGPGMMPQSHPQQNMYPLSLQGGMMPTNNYMNGPHQMIKSFARVPHQSNMPPPQQSQPQMHAGMVTNQQQLANNQQQLANNSTSVRYLVNAYRVGMFAMSTLAKRVQDDRPQAKYAKNPPYGEDVKWLLGIAKKLGSQSLHQFCHCSVNCVASPFILYDLALEVASYLSRNNSSLYHQNLRSPILQPLIQKCQTMFKQCTHLKIYYITPSDYDDFIAILRAARLAFQMSVGGGVEFSDLVQTVRRSKSCKKELWDRISLDLQQGPV